MGSAFVQGFRPSAAALHYANDFPDEAVVEIPLGSTRIPVGNAANGLCGGMVFAVRDLFEAGAAPPPDTAPPARGTPAFGFLVRRLVESWAIPQGPLKYQLWMSLPDGDTWWGRGVAWRTMRQEWPLVRADVDAGVPSPLGVIRTRSWNPWDLGLNHQVLAYGYDLDDASGALELFVYDPNHPDDDSVAILTNVRAMPPPFAYRARERPVRGFFRVAYAPRDPSPLLA